MFRLLSVNHLVMSASCLLSAIALAQPVVPRPAQPQAKPPVPTTPGQPVRPMPAHDPNEIDWRGLGEGPKKKAGGHDSAVSDLIRNAPYRVEVATTDGVKLSLTNALTLERRRVFDGPTVAGFGFAPDGAWLYVVTNDGDLFAVEPDSAAVEKIGKLPLAAEQVIVELVGGGSITQHEFTLWLAKGPGPAVGTCPGWRDMTRVHVRHTPGTRGAAIAAAQPGWAEPPEAGRTNPTSPNTKYRAQIDGGALYAAARFGGGQFKLNRTALPNNIADLQWMRDSDGVVATFPRKAASGCRQRPGVRVWRDDNRQGATGWQEWTAPENLDIAWPDVHAGLQWAPDGMRLLGADPRGVVIVEPSPRFRGPIALIAPPSKLWPKFRPGVRSLPASAAPAYRHAELLLEQGDIDGAAKLLRGVKESDAKALVQRLKKLEDVRARRSEELQLDLADLRSDKSQRSPPKPPVVVAPVALPTAVTPTPALPQTATPAAAAGTQ